MRIQFVWIYVSDSAHSTHSKWDFYSLHGRKDVRTIAVNSTGPGTACVPAGVSVTVQALLGDKPLKDVTITLRDASGGEVVSKTNSKGTAYFKDLAPGSWNWQAESPQENCFLLSPQNSFRLNVKPKNLYLRFAKGGKISIKTVQGHSKDPYPKAKAEITDENHTVVDTLITDENGSAASKYLPPGQYRIKWVSNESHFTDISEQSVTVSESHVADVTGQFFRYASVKIEVTDYAQRALVKASIKLTRRETKIESGSRKRRQKTISGILIPNKEGILNTFCFNGLLPGKYGIVQKKTPQGYSSLFHLEDITLLDGQDRTIRIEYHTQVKDKFIKTLISDPYILAHFLRNFTSEYYGMEIDDILKTFKNQDSDSNSQVTKIRGLQNEEASGNNGMLIFDNIFCFVIPAKANTDNNAENGNIVIFVDIEGESQAPDDYTYAQRGIAHISHMITAQRGTAEGYTDGKYQNIKRCYCFFICIDPGEEKENTVKMYDLKKSELDLKTGLFVETQIDIKDDLIKIVEINLGDYTQLPKIKAGHLPASVNGLAIMDILAGLSGMSPEQRKSALANHGFIMPDPIVKEVTKVWRRDSSVAKRTEKETEKKWKGIVREKDKELERLREERDAYKRIAQQSLASGQVGQTAPNIIP